MLTDPVQQAVFMFAPELKIGLAGMQGLLAHSTYGAAKMAAAQAIEEPLLQYHRAQSGLPYGWGEAGEEVLDAAKSGLAMELGGRALLRGSRRALTGHWLPPKLRGKVESETGDKAIEGDPAALREVSDAVPDDAALRGAAGQAEIQAMFRKPDGVDNGEHLDRLADAILGSLDDEAAIPPGDATHAKDYAERQRIALDRLSDDAKEMVADGSAPKEIAALVGDHVTDPRSACRADRRCHAPGAAE